MPSSSTSVRSVSFCDGRGRVGEREVVGRDAASTGRRWAQGAPQPGPQQRPCPAPPPPAAHLHGLADADELGGDGDEVGQLGELGCVRVGEVAVERRELVLDGRDHLRAGRVRKAARGGAGLPPPPLAWLLATTSR